MASFAKLRLGCVACALSLGIAASIAELVIRRMAPTVVRVDDAEAAANTGVVAGPEALLRFTNEGKRLIAGAEVVVRNHRLSHRDIRISLNSQGFRDDEIPLAKPPCEQRILVLGDSITWGDYLPADEVYVERIEQELRRRNPNQSIQVINAGVGDIGFKEELAILREKGLAMTPDIVVVAFYLNDSRPPWGFPEELARPGWLRRHSALARWLTERFRLKRWIHQQGEERFRWIPLTRSLDWMHDRQAFLTLAAHARFDWGAAWTPGSWEQLAPYFDELAALARDHHFAVLLTAFPVVFQVNAEFIENTPQRRLERIARDHGFRYLDLLPLLRSQNDPNLFFDQCHPTSASNKLIGRVMAEALDTMLYFDLDAPMPREEGPREDGPRSEYGS